MAIEDNIGKNAGIFDTESKTLRLTLPESMTGWALRFTLSDGGNAFITKTTSGGITVNATEALIYIAKADWEGKGGRFYDYRIERTNAGSEGVLTFGRLWLWRG